MILVSPPGLAIGKLINERTMDILVLKEIMRSLGEVTSQLAERG